ncbi:hypothetical protein PTKIN_Ptkin02bG0061800 [Pterospermum kingtungense]
MVKAQLYFLILGSAKPRTKRQVDMRGCTTWVPQVGRLDHSQLRAPESKDGVDPHKANNHPPAPAWETRTCDLALIPIVRIKRLPLRQKLKLMVKAQLYFLILGSAKPRTKRQVDMRGCTTCVPQVGRLDHGQLRAPESKDGVDPHKANKF